MMTIIAIAIVTFYVSIDKLMAQQWVWDEIYRDRQDTASDDSSFGGFVGLCLFVAIIWIISKIVKVGKEEHTKRMKQRKQNEKKTDDILSNIDDLINSLNNKNKNE